MIANIGPHDSECGPEKELGYEFSRFKGWYAGQKTLEEAGSPPHCRRRGGEWGQRDHQRGRPVERNEILK
jgi:hypothetical protein